MEVLPITLFLVVFVAFSEQTPLYFGFPTNQGPTSKSERITNGDIAKEGQLPYQVGLKIHPRVGSTTVFCGGTLISKRYVLTAAHCCVGAYKIEVILGSVEIYNETKPSRVSMNVLRKYVKIHEDYDSQGLVNDICVMRLPNEVELSDNIQIAELPTDDLNDYVDEPVIVSGWGVDSDETTAISPVLKYVKSNVIKNFICNIFYLGGIKNTHICTNGAGGKSTCTGDSGGPLVLEKTKGNSTTVIGITSFGISFGCESGWPPAFTRVSKYIEWINKNIV